MVDTVATPGSRASFRLAGVSLLMAGLGVLLLLPLVGVEVDPPLPLPATALIIATLYVLAELSVFHLEVRGQAFTIMLSDLPLVMGLFLLSPQWLLAAGLLPSLVIAFARRTHWAKAAYNGGLFILEIAVASLILELLAPARAPEPISWVAAYLAVVVLNLLATGAVTLAMKLLDNPPSRRDIVQVIAAVTTSGTLSTTLALMALLVLNTTYSGLLLIAALVFVAAVAHRAYYRLLRQHSDLNRLFSFTQTVGSAQEADGVVTQLQAQARDLLNAESASVRLLANITMPGTPDDLTSEARPRVIPRTTRDPRERRWLGHNGLRDALLVPLRDKDDVVAVLQVSNRRGAAGTFTNADLRLLQTLVAHAEVLWHNGRLLEQLRYEAMHDNLTGLANRALFNTELQEYLDGGGQGAVLLLDLDRFKEVNDALGHPVGDVLLQRVAARLMAHVPAGTVVSRLGGDEFAVLLRGTDSAEDAVATARAARAALTGAFEVEGTYLEVGASVGVAMVPADGRDPATLLRRADMAMYEAKGSSTGVARYVPEFDHRSSDLLELAGELRHAVENDQIVMWFQPKESLRSGRIVGFEALARWHHPQRGRVMPDVFVPLAEQTGLVHLLTQTAVVQSLQQCRGWLATTPGVGVAVNLSPRSLLEPSLPGSVSDLLERTGVPADLLTLEITEDSVMADPDTAVRALHQLRDLGVRLSVDDFGTGYSSLNYLQRLPVHEVKIDKSFILPMRRDPGATAIVRSITELAHNLDLTVVAEGVEDDATREQLAEIGCDVIQGYGLSHPMPPDEVGPWLVDRRDTTRRTKRAARRAV